MQKLSKQQLKFQQDILAILDKFKAERGLERQEDYIKYREYVEDRLKELESKPAQPTSPQHLVFSTYDIHVQLKHPFTLDQTIVHNRIAEATQELGKLCMKYGIAHVTATEAKNGPGLPINH